METLIPLAKQVVSYKDTFFRSKLKFMFIIRAKVRPTRTTKDLNKSIIRRFHYRNFSMGVFMSRPRVGNLLMRKQVVRNASLQK